MLLQDYASSDDESSAHPTLKDVEIDAQKDAFNLGGLPLSTRSSVAVKKDVVEVAPDVLAEVRFFFFSFFFFCSCCCRCFVYKPTCRLVFVVESCRIQTGKRP